MPWLCYWEYIYGVYPPEKAWKSDDEPFVITQEGDKICQSCAKNWRREKKKQRKST
jgi:hypothetical protein